MKKVNILTLLVDRANYGRLKPLMLLLNRDKRFTHKVLCSGSMPLRRFGKVSEIVRQDGFETLDDIYMEVEGGENLSMGISIGVGIQLFSLAIANHRPDYLLVIGDRFEALAAVIASVYLNIRVIHIQGGEISGSIDESNRHAITKMAHMHFPATESAKNIIIKMGENPKFVHNVGCPVGDLILGNKLPQLSSFINDYNLNLSIDESYAVVVFHPNTISFIKSLAQIKCLRNSLQRILEEQMVDKIIWFWPNIDAGSDTLHVILRELSNSKHHRFSLVKNMMPDHYQALLKDASILVGNSSSFVRDSSFTGVPVLLVGDRQKGREVSSNTMQIDSFDEEIIIENIRQILSSDRGHPSYLYGTGDASSKILELIYSLDPPVQKTFFSKES